VIKTFFRYLLRTLLALIIVILLWLILAHALPYITFQDQTKEKKTVVIFIESNGVHTDFVMPVKSALFDWSRCLLYADFEIAGPSFEYVSVGWGDKGFYIGTPTWADLRFTTAFKAAFGLSTSAIHVSYRRFQPKEKENCKRLVLSESQYKRLVNYILNSFQWKEGKFIAIDHPGYSDHDCFYEANGTYTMFNTCNEWTGKGLRATGIPTGVWTPLPGGVLQNLE
jgi:uncharacterized protein (TIGR02117 family)